MPQHPACSGTPGLAHIACRAGWVLIIVGCGGIGGQSDVPSFNPEWSSSLAGYLVRLDEDGGDDLYLTALTYDQLDEDELDGVLGNGPRQQVYRYNRTTRAFSPVDDVAWDSATGEVVECGDRSREDTAFDLEGLNPPRLTFVGHTVSPPGGTPVQLKPSRISDAVAVLSTSGAPGVSFFIGYTQSTGQHHHQAYSLDDGLPIGPSGRLPLQQLGPLDGQICWTANDEYVIYSNADFRLLSVVRMRETLRDDLPERLSDVPSFQPTLWRADRALVQFRVSPDGQSALITANLEDHNNSCPPEGCDLGMGAVYELGLRSGDSSVVDASRWEQATSFVQQWNRGNPRVSAFSISDSGTRTLLYEGTEVALEAGKPVRISPSFDHDIVAILSAEGTLEQGPHAASGQHYHQLFSERTGKPLGPALRVAVGGAGFSPVTAWWTSDDRAVVYQHAHAGRELSKTNISVVPIGRGLLDRFVHGTSDVPALEPSAWPDDAFVLLVREVGDGSGVLLLTSQTISQRLDDRPPDARGPEYKIHGVTYQYASGDNGLILVEAVEWDEAGTEVTSCDGFQQRNRDEPESPFFTSAREIKYAPDFVYFMAETVEVAGGFGLDVFPTPTAGLAAILSSDRPPPGFETTAPGQHYHQIFSESTGLPIGPSVRIGVGGVAKPSVRACWTNDRKFVIYSQGDTAGDSIGKLWIVPVDQP